MLLLVMVVMANGKYACTSYANCDYKGCNDYLTIDESWAGCVNIVNGARWFAFGDLNVQAISNYYTTFPQNTNDWNYCAKQRAGSNWEWCPNPCAVSCPTGQYVLNCVCTACPGGSFCTGTSAISGTCAVGQYSGTGQGSCTSCGAGTYGTATGLSACTACGAGTYSTAVGATDASTCVNCIWAHYSNEGATACTSCRTMW
jgi:hypothetical protein